MADLIDAGMIDAGMARPDELDSILDVMCEAFEMPYSAARAIYYSDPYLDYRTKYVVRVNGKLVSCLTVMDARCHVGGATVGVAGIAGVATRPSHRRKGYAALLLTTTMTALARQGVALAALFPFATDYYRRFGWETCGVVWRCVVPARTLPAYNEPAMLRHAQESDIPALDSLYVSACRSRNLSCVRDPKRWRYILERTPDAVVCVSQNGCIAGYVLYDTRLGIATLGAQSSTEPRLRVQEIVTGSGDARRALICHLASHCPAGGIEYSATWQDLKLSGLLDYGGDNPGIRIEQLPGIMVRVLDLNLLAVQLCDAWTGFQGSLELVMEDPLLSAAPQVIRIVGDGCGAPRVSVPDKTGTPAVNRIEGHVRSWTQVMLGAVRVEDALASGLLRGSGAAALELATGLFPYNPPFLSVPDHF